MEGQTGCCVVCELSVAGGEDRLVQLANGVGRGLALGSQRGPHQPCDTETGLALAGPSDPVGDQDESIAGGERR
jgi:hypothetical protein